MTASYPLQTYKLLPTQGRDLQAACRRGRTYGACLDFRFDLRLTDVRRRDLVKRAEPHAAAVVAVDGQSPFVISASELAS